MWQLAKGEWTWPEVKPLGTIEAFEDRFLKQKFERKNPGR